MSGAGISIDVKYPDKRVRDVLSRAARAVADRRTMFSEIGEYLIESHKDRFAQQVDPEGRPWEPLKESTKAKKKRNAGKILIEYGQLMDEMHYNAGPDSLIFGSNQPYAATHQFGDESRGIPARPHIGISSKDETEILAIAEDHIMRAIQSM